MAVLTYDDMIRLLKKLDSQLQEPLSICVTGASAIILRGEDLMRNTQDIDLTSTDKDLEETGITKLISKIGHEENVDTDWLNDRAKICLKFLPDEYEIITHPLPSDIKFSKLSVSIIDPIETVVTKLAQVDYIRGKDEGDIQNLPLTPKETLALYERFNEIQKYDEVRGLSMEIAFKNLRTELVLNNYGERFYSAEEIAEYAAERYDRCLSVSEKSEIQDRIHGEQDGAAKAIIEIDRAHLVIIKARKITNCMSNLEWIQEKSKTGEMIMSFGNNFCNKFEKRYVSYNPETKEFVGFKVGPENPIEIIRTIDADKCSTYIEKDYARQFEHSNTKVVSPSRGMDI